MRVLVPTGDQKGWARLVLASITTGRFVAQEMMKSALAEPVCGHYQDRFSDIFLSDQLDGDGEKCGQ